MTITEAPAKVTNSRNLLAQADEQIKKLNDAKQLIEANAEMLDLFESGSVGSSLGISFYLHCPPPNVIDLCRSIGGNWKKTITGTRVDYSKDGYINFTIFGAESLESFTEDLKLC